MLINKLWDPLRKPVTKYHGVMWYSPWIHVIPLKYWGKRKGEDQKAKKISLQLKHLRPKNKQHYFLCIMQQHDSLWLLYWSLCLRKHLGRCSNGIGGHFRVPLRQQKSHWRILFPWPKDPTTLSVANISKLLPLATIKRNNWIPLI